jgi:hypothetical protein
MRYVAAYTLYHDGQAIAPGEEVPAGLFDEALMHRMLDTGHVRAEPSLEEAGQAAAEAEGLRREATRPRVPVRAKKAPRGEGAS